MTINEAIVRAKRLRPNTIEEQDQAKWLIDLDGRIYEETLKKDKPECTPARTWPEDGDKPLLAAAPYDGLYELYLMAKICFTLGEYEDYNNLAEQFGREMNDYRAWWRREHVPKSTCFIKGV